MGPRMPYLEGMTTNEPTTETTPEQPDWFDEFDRTGFDALDWACLIPDE